MQHISFVEASPQNGVEACYLTVSKLMVSPTDLCCIPIAEPTNLTAIQAKSTFSKTNKDLYRGSRK